MIHVGAIGGSGFQPRPGFPMKTSSRLEAAPTNLDAAAVFLRKIFRQL
jgi:hypothetical protein